MSVYTSTDEALLLFAQWHAAKGQHEWAVADARYAALVAEVQRANPQASKDEVRQAVANAS